MTFNEGHAPGSYPLMLLASLICASCLTPQGAATPCPPEGSAPTPTTTATSGGASAGSVTTSGATATAPPAGKLVVWDGDGQGTSAKGWCEKKDVCKLAPTPDGGRAGMGLEFHAEGPEWQGFGWNWYGWWPSNAGTDISQYKNLTFWIRVQGKSAKEAPEPKSVKIRLVASSSEDPSSEVPVADYVPSFADGQWHEVTIPLADLLKGDGAKFDAHTAWEFRIGTWAADARNFDLYFDEIGFN
jgi:hypothetical protein